MSISDTTLVYLCTYQGVEYLDEQIRSILDQSVPIELWVSDDGSTDGTRELVMSYVTADSRVKIMNGPKRGFVANFLSVFERKGVSKYPFIAFADQDDLWDRDKLERAQRYLGLSSIPMLYGSATRLMRQDGKVFGFSALRRRPLSFSNAMVESFAGGNTMVINQSAVRWVMDIRTTLGAHRDHWVSHDWMLYLVITLGGYPVVHDPYPSLYYRQHAANLIGENRSVSAQIGRVGRFITGQYGRMVQYHQLPLCLLRSRMTPSAVSILNGYIALRESTGFPSIKKWLQLGLYRQRTLDNFALLIAFIARGFP
ncbi:glycosyltransferase [Litoricolaceae bacterium]|nr:glycosyltransferase [Litorivicinaceae bacterium]